MVIDLTPEQEAELQIIAEFEGKTPQQFLLDLAFIARQEDAEFRRTVSERIKQADHGTFVEEDEMDARITKMLGR